MLRKDLTWQIRNTVAKMSQAEQTKNKKKLKNILNMGGRMGQGGWYIYIYIVISRKFV